MLWPQAGTLPDMGLGVLFRGEEVLATAAGGANLRLAGTRNLCWLPVRSATPVVASKFLKTWPCKPVSQDQVKENNFEILAEVKTSELRPEKFVESEEHENFMWLQNTRYHSEQPLESSVGSSALNSTEST